jgi:hypothetical protein
MGLHTVTFSAVGSSVNFPAGTTVGPVVASLVNGPSAVPSVNLDSNNTAVFQNVPDGAYILTVQATDASGAPLGATYQNSQIYVNDVVATNVPVFIPTGGTVTIV